MWKKKESECWLLVSKIQNHFINIKSIKIPFNASDKLNSCKSMNVFDYKTTKLQVQMFSTIDATEDDKGEYVKVNKDKL